ncbi:hypothetical protein ACFQUX_17955 [Pantoea stewartii]
MTPLILMMSCRSDERPSKWAQRPNSAPPYPGSAPDATRYDYEWQKPKAAICVDKTPVVDLVELGQEQEFLAWVKVTLAPLPRFIRLRLASRIDSIHTMKGRHIARLALRDIIRRDLPPINMVNEQYAIAMTDEAKSQADTAFKGLNPLYHTFNTLHGLVERFNHLPDFTPEDVELLAQDIAIYMRSVLSEVHETVETQSDRKYAGYLYTEAAVLARLFFLTPPSWTKYCRGRCLLMRLLPALARCWMIATGTVT